MGLPIPTLKIPKSDEEKFFLKLYLVDNRAKIRNIKQLTRSIFYFCILFVVDEKFTFAKIITTVIRYLHLPNALRFLRSLFVYNKTRHKWKQNRVSASG